MKLDRGTRGLAIVGAIPPVMGYAAATGSLLTPERVTCQHLVFMAVSSLFSLAWIHRNDCAGGYKMVPAADAGKRTAK